MQPAANGFAPRGMPGIAWNTCDSPSPWAGIAAADAVTARRAYYASVAETDVQVGRLLAALEGAGLGGETAVVLHADHGWTLGEVGTPPPGPPPPLLAPDSSLALHGSTILGEK